MPLDPTGKEITMGSIVSYPRTATKAGYGMVTALSPARARINNMVFKSYEAIFIIEAPDEEVQRLRAMFATQLAIPPRPFTPKFALVRFYNGGGANHYYSFIKSEDGSAATIKSKARRIMDNINIDIPRTDRQRRITGFAYASISTEKLIVPKWSFVSIGIRRANRLNVATMEEIIFTRDQMIGMGYTFL